MVVVGKVRCLNLWDLREMYTGLLLYNSGVLGERSGLDMQIWGHHCVSNNARPEMAEITQKA